MSIQVFVDNSNYNIIIKDGNKYYHNPAGILSRKYTQGDLFEVCDIDGNGEYELIYVTDYGSGKLYEFLCCYSNTKTIHCSFGIDRSYDILSKTSIIENNDGTYNLNLQGNTDGKLNIEQIEGEYWLTVTYPEDAQNDDNVYWNSIQTVEKIRTSGKLTHLPIGSAYLKNIYDKPFGKEDTALIEISSYLDKENKVITVGNAELYYSIQKDAYIGLVDRNNVDNEKNLCLLY